MANSTGPIPLDVFDDISLTPEEGDELAFRENAERMSNRVTRK